MVFVIEILLLRCGNIGIDIQIGDNLTSMFEVMHLNVRKTGTLMPHAHLSWKTQCAG
jgi:hypothetical protein